MPQTAELAQRNLSLNPEYKSKIKLFNFGLAGRDGTVEIKRLEHSDPSNSLNPDFSNKYRPEERTRGIPQTCTIKKASTVLRSIIQENDIKDIIFKIDVEGAEYEIMENIRDEYPEIFERIHIIFGETHLGFEKFYNMLPKGMFEILAIAIDKNANNGFGVFCIERKAYE